MPDAAERPVMRRSQLSVRIETATRQDFAEIAAVLAIAYADDPVHRDIITEHPRRDVRLWRYFETLLRATDNDRLEVTVARRTDDRIVGVSVWQYMPVGHEGEMPGLLPHLGGLIRALGLRNLARALRVQRSLQRHRPVDEHWYLPFVGVLPEVRRNRVATALLGTKLSQLDELGLPGYLYSRTPADRRFFQNLGFGHGAVVGSLPSARPLAMFRPPARRRRR
jgi:GNAT superfamily N-acetyltransferase